MIRARMSFGGCFISRPPTQEELDKRKAEQERCTQLGVTCLTNMDPNKHELFSITLDDAIGYLEEKPEEW